MSSSYLAGNGAKFVYAHAVQVIGYNNEQEYWLAKNSWGSGFADDGYFKIVFGAAGICDEARGLIFTAFNPLPPPLDRVRLVETKPGCYSYRATSWDYVSQVATVFRMAPQKVLLDNVNVIPDPGMFLAGLTVMLCGTDDVPGLPVAVGDGAPGVRSMSQLDALLDIKLAVDRDDVLDSWTKSSGADGGYCNWIGVMCDGNSNVLNVLPGGNLNGVLPNIGALRALPKLVTLALFKSGLQGTLPADWSALTNLQKLYLWGNQFSGPLPAAWGAMKTLQVLSIGTNQLSGPLPAQWSAMSNLQELYIFSNKLSGPLPAAWGSMARLREFDGGTNQLSGPLPAEWSRMSNLVVLRLNDNKLSGPLPGQWSAMTKLKELTLDTNGFTGLLPPEWGRLAELQTLRFSWSKVSGSLPGRWGDMTKLVTLSLGGNQLSGAVPAAQWKGMTSLKFLYLLDNSQLSGCLPATWKGRVNEPGTIDDNGYEPKPRYAYGPESGTKITGFCL